MVDKSNSELYKVKFISHDAGQGYAVYKFKIIGPQNISFHVQDRYSSMKKFSSDMKKKYPIRNVLPHFPPKKFLGNKEENFLKLREN